MLENMKSLEVAYFGASKAKLRKKTWRIYYAFLDNLFHQPLLSIWTWSSLPGNPGPGKKGDCCFLSLSLASTHLRLSCGLEKSKVVYLRRRERRRRRGRGISWDSFSYKARGAGGGESNKNIGGEVGKIIFVSFFFCLVTDSDSSSSSLSLSLLSSQFIISSFSSSPLLPLSSRADSSSFCFMRGNESAYLGSWMLGRLDGVCTTYTCASTRYGH